jgi:RNA polymerase sigma-70 factor (ECF subfamily)
MDDSEIKSLHEAGRYDEATTSVLASHGREIFGFMRARLRDEDAAKEAYSMFALDLWKGMPGFRRQCPFRAWAYAIARNAANRHAGRARRELPWDDDAPPELLQLTRTATAEYLRTDVKSRFAELRDKLSEEDQTVLVLRVDKRMEWRDVASVLLGADASAADLDREATRLRQQFRLLKQRLKSLARAEGLLSDGEE